MSPQSHLWLRVGALVLLVTAAIWPRGSRAGHGAEGMSAAEVMRGASDAAMVHAAARTARGGAARAGTTGARLASPPRTAKVPSFEPDESSLNN